MNKTEGFKTEMYKVAILMSTYNGEDYLGEQINTILRQKNVEIDLYVRDDGSKDETLQIVEDYRKKYKNIFLIEGINFGVGNSFMELVYQVPKKYDYYAFADQDDVWLLEKIIKAIEFIRNEKGPVLYASNQTIVDQRLIKRGNRYDTEPDVSYKQIMCNNLIAGCTMVWNNTLCSLLSDVKRRPSAELLQNRIHDVWVAMVASVIGKILYDSNSYILYRQHNANVVGVKGTNVFFEWKRKIADSKFRNGRSAICNEVLKCFGDLVYCKDVYNNLLTYSKYKESFKFRMLLIKDESLLNHTKENRLSLKLKIALGLF